MKNLFSDTLSTLISFGIFYVFAFRGLFPVVNGQSLPVTVTNPETQATTQQVITAFTGFNTIHFVYAFLLSTLIGSLVAFGLRYLFQNFELTVNLPFQKKRKFNGHTESEIEEAIRRVPSTPAIDRGA